MKNSINRRKFIIGSTAMGIASGVSANVNAQTPMVKKWNIKPVVVASGNGHTMKNGGKFNNNKKETKNYDSDDSAAEVEAGAGGAYNNGNNERLKRQVTKLESKIVRLERKIKDIETPHERLDDLHDRLLKIENKKSSTCAVM